MKIVYLHQYFVTPKMAGGSRSYEMARRLVSAGHEVHMITSDQSGGTSLWRETREEGIHVHWASVRYSNEMSFVRRIVAFLSFAVRCAVRALRLRGDVVFATSTPLTIAIPALLVSTLQRIPFVFEVRDMWPDVPIAIGAIRNPLLVRSARCLELLAYRRATQIVALAPGMRDDIVAKGIACEKIVVIPNGCDLDVFGSAAGLPSPRAENEWLAGRKLVLFAGTLGLVNGVDYLVRIAGSALEIDPEIRFVIIGAGGERARIRELAEREGVLGRNLFMLDAMAKRDLARWIASADLVMALFTGPRVVWKDAVQNKFFDALAAGKPVANNFDGWQSRIAVEHGVGVIVDSDDPASASRVIARVLNDDEWRADVAARARALAEGLFNRDRLAAQLNEVFASVVRR